MKKTLLIAAALSLATAALAAEKTKSFDATYTATIAGVPAGTNELKVWIPLPATRGAQSVSDVAIDSPYKFERYKDAEFGNEYAFATIANPPAGDLAIKVNFKATRHEESIASPFETAAKKSELDRA